MQLNTLDVWMGPNFKNITTGNSWFSRCSFWNFSNTYVVCQHGFTYNIAGDLHNHPA